MCYNTCSEVINLKTREEVEEIRKSIWNISQEDYHKKVMEYKAAKDAQMAKNQEAENKNFFVKIFKFLKRK